ncbi:hypothetical protein KUCAC02_036313, partial [Chaenocephalus aceratus]
PANPTKPHTREHCRIRIPHPEELVKRVEGVFQHFHLATDPNGRPLFKASLLKCWRIQRIHILRGCPSDPEVEGGIMYRHGGTLQLNHVPGEGARVPVWIPIRGTSQQEGYHFHQAQWVTGTRVSTELFQAQAMTGVARWNYQRLVDLKQPDVKLPAVFDPALMGEINAVSQQVFGHVNQTRGDCRNGSGASHRARNHMSEVSAVLANCGSHWTCERVFVLDHKRWTGPMKQAVDNLLNTVEDLQRLNDAYAFCGIQPANPTKPHTREHCRIPHPEELSKRVEGVFQHFHLATDPNGRPLFKASLLKCWRIQRIHILRGCLSDPEVEGGIMYRHGGTLQLNHVPGEGARVPVWIPIRGTSQQEGYHFHQAQWVTGTRVSTELFQAQAMTGVARWNYQRLVDLKQPDVKLPAVFDPALMGEINAVSQQVFGHVNETRGDCRNDAGASHRARNHMSEVSAVLANCGSHWTCERVFVLDHKRWTGPMKQAVDNLLNTVYVKHLSKLLNTSTSINISPEKLQERQVLWHSLTEGSETTRVPVVSMLDAVFNPTPPVQTPATPPVQTQPPLSDPATPPVQTPATPPVQTPATPPVQTPATPPVQTPATPAVQTPATPPVQTPATPPVQTPATPLTLEHVENIVRNIMDKHQQQQHQQQQKKKQTKRCLSCGQPKARFENDGSSIHHFYMQGTVRYFYCSTNVFKTYGAEGLTDPKMPFGDFAETAFFQRDLEAMKQRVEARVQLKRKNTEPEHKGRKCGFCRKELKQGPNSPHIHTGFPGVAGKYVYCPAKVLSIEMSRSNHVIGDRSRSSCSDPSHTSCSDPSHTSCSDPSHTSCSDPSHTSDTRIY